MIYSADLHIHTDVLESGRIHGDTPDNIARGIVNSGVDVYAITEHNRVAGDHLSEVQEEIYTIKLFWVFWE